MTDEFPSYVGIGTDFEGGHETVNHGEKEYVRGDAHVNGAESYFALLKRGIHGTFHHVSKKHLPLPSTVMDDIDTLILAGGKGTRLAGALPEGLPKCMADINGTPFLVLLLRILERQGLRRFILCLGYGHDIVKSYWRRDDWLAKAETVFSEETEPLGTAGAILNARKHIETPNFLVVNGDTLCIFDIADFVATHKEVGAVASAAVDDAHHFVGTFVFNHGIFPHLKTGTNIEDYVSNPEKAKVGFIDWLYVSAPFHDIGTPEGLKEFRRIWS